MRDIIFAIMMLLVVFSACIAWKSYEYRDCKMVGHTTFYCIMGLGR
jgi:hypothetical protein